MNSDTMAPPGSGGTHSRKRPGRASGKRRGRTAKGAGRTDSRIASARESFAAAVGQLRSETHFRAWLEAQRRLHRYSPRNILWILFQRPDATHVASYNAWKNELGYQVRRGEQSIKVWVPGRRKQTETDPETGEEVEVGRPFFLLGSVFDRSQVDPIPGEARPLEPPRRAPVEGDSHEWAIAGLEAFAVTLGYEVRRLALREGNGGFCDYRRRLIGVSRSISANEQVRVLAHEAAHASGIDSKTFGRGRAEAIVDCSAHIVCARIGLDVSAASVPYVAAWAADDDGVIARDAGEIDRVTRGILRGAGLEEGPGD